MNAFGKKIILAVQRVKFIGMTEVGCVLLRGGGLLNLPEYGMGRVECKHWVILRWAGLLVLVVELPRIGRLAFGSFSGKHCWRSSLHDGAWAWFTWSRKWLVRKLQAMPR
jgi:hypothetical protein